MGIVNPQSPICLPVVHNNPHPLRGLPRETTPTTHRNAWYKSVAAPYSILSIKLGKQMSALCQRSAGSPSEWIVPFDRGSNEDETIKYNWNVRAETWVEAV